MRILLTTTCPHVSAAIRDNLNLDGNKPTVASCLACSKIVFNEREVSVSEPDHDMLPVSPGSMLGQALFGATIGKDRFGLGLEAKMTQTGMCAMYVNGVPGGSLYIIRQTSAGPVLLFPGSSTRWHDRMIHPDDLYWFFGDAFADPRLQRKEITVYDLLQDGIKAGKLNLGVRSLVRTG